jgi:ATP-dependent DNA ligase
MTRDLNKLFGLEQLPPAGQTSAQWARDQRALNFPVIPRAAADAMRINRRPQHLMMTPIDFREELMPEVAITQIKWDGIHTGYRPDQPHAFTREGVDMLCTDHLRPGLSATCAALRALFSGEWIVFGEYCRADGFNATLGDFKRGKGEGCVILFDAVPLAVWEGRETSPGLETRLRQLDAAVQRVGRDALGGVGATKWQTFRGETRDYIVPAMPGIWADGLEGLVVKDAASPYVRAPSPHWLRLKRRNTVDVKVASVHTRGGSLAGFEVLHGTVLVKVGVGLKAADRVPGVIRPGMIVEIAHLGVTPAGSLRSPSFVRVRTDKES